MVRDTLHKPPPTPENPSKRGFIWELIDPDGVVLPPIGICGREPAAMDAVSLELFRAPEGSHGVVVHARRLPFEGDWKPSGWGRVAKRLTDAVVVWSKEVRCAPADVGDPVPRQGPPQGTASLPAAWPRGLLEKQPRSVSAQPTRPPGGGASLPEGVARHPAPADRTR